jgi:hypothetical protein
MVQSVLDLYPTNSKSPLTLKSRFEYLGEMSNEISFCPLCAGKLDSETEERFQCEDCETQFLIQLIDSDDDDDEDDEDEEEEDDDRDDEDEEEEKDKDEEVDDY